jgi:hypothetical protein
MIRRLVEGGRGGQQFDLHITGERGGDSYTLVRTGNKWNKPYQGTKAINVTSDGNKLEATIYKDHTGRKAKTIELAKEKFYKDLRETK